MVIIIIVTVNVVILVVIVAIKPNRTVSSQSEALNYMAPSKSAEISTSWIPTILLSRKKSAQGWRPNSAL